MVFLPAALRAECSSIFRFVREVLRHWGALVTSGAIIGTISIWQATGHRVNGGVYWAVAIVGAFIAFYRAWTEERVAKEKAIAIARPSGTTTTEWKDVADRFERQSNFVSAQWVHWSYGNRDFWNLSGGSQQDRAECENLCRLAGAMLAKSPHASSELSGNNSDSLNRWLNYLKDNHRALDVGRAYNATETLDSGDKNVIIGGVISHIARISAAVCIHCAAREL